MYKSSPHEITNITLDPRLPFLDSVGGIFLVQPLLTKVYQGIEWFSQLAGLQSLTVLSMLIRGITITLTGDLHSGRLAALPPSIMLRNSLLTDGKIRHISVLGMLWLTKIMVQLLKHNCNGVKQESIILSNVYKSRAHETSKKSVTDHYLPPGNPKFKGEVQ